VVRVRAILNNEYYSKLFINYEIGILAAGRIGQDEGLPPRAADMIVLVASSVGSTFGLAMAKRRPDLFVAYVGTDQNTSPDAQGLSYQLTLTWLRESGQ
jgi:hypothetical protein